MVQRRLIGLLFLAFALFAQASRAPAAFVDHRATDTLCAAKDGGPAAPADDATNAGHRHSHCVLCGALAVAVATWPLIARLIDYPPPARPLPPRPPASAASPSINANAPPHAPPALS